MIEAKKEWIQLKKKLDNNSDSKVTFSEVLLAYARENGIYVDQIPKKTKAELKEQFENVDIDENGYITEEDIIDLYIDMYETLAEQGVPLK